MLKRLLLASLAAVTVAGIGFAAQPTGKTIVYVQNEPATNGRMMFVSYCAPCHGMDGRGHGPVATSLRTPPTDLTQISRDNHGKFPMNHVMNVLGFGVNTPAHGTAGMPVWGQVFDRMNVSEPQVRILRISNLSRYLETIQAK